MPALDSIGLYTKSNLRYMSHARTLLGSYGQQIHPEHIVLLSQVMLASLFLSKSNL